MLTFSGLSEAIAAGEQANWLATCDFSGAAAEGTDLTLDVAEGAASGIGNTYGESVASTGTATGAKITIVSFSITKALIKRSSRSKADLSSKADSKAKITGAMPPANVVGPVAVSVGAFSQTIALTERPRRSSHSNGANPQQLVFRSPKRSSGVQRMKIDLRRGTFAIKLARAGILDWNQVLSAALLEQAGAASANVPVTIEIRNGSNVLVEEITMQKRGKVLKFKKQ